MKRTLAYTPVLTAGNNPGNLSTGTSNHSQLDSACARHDGRSSSDKRSCGSAKLQSNHRHQQFCVARKDDISYFLVVALKSLVLGLVLPIKFHSLKQTIDVHAKKKQS